MITIKEPLNKERRINKIYIHFLSKQNIKAPLILHMYVFLKRNQNLCFKELLKNVFALKGPLF